MTSRQPVPRRREDQGVLRRLVSRRNVLKTGAFASVLGASASGSVAARRSGRGNYRPPVPVVDREDPEPDPAIVIDGLDVPISDWTVFDSETVADQNPDYDPGGRVVIVAFERLLDAGWPDWRRAEPDALFDGVVERGIKFHAFPEARLHRGRPRGGGRGR